MRRSSPGLPLICQPGAEWNYSRSTDILGRVVEVVSGKTARQLPHRPYPRAAADDGYRLPIEEERAHDRLAEPFPNDPWTGNKVVYFSMTQKPVSESGGGGMVSTAPDYARFAQMLANGGTLNGERIIGRKTLELMASNHLGPEVKITTTHIPPGHGFGLGFAVRLQPGMAPYPGSVGQYFWGGAAGTQFWVDPKEDLWARADGAGAGPARVSARAVPQSGLRGGRGLIAHRSHAKLPLHVRDRLVRSLFM